MSLADFIFWPPFLLIFALGWSAWKKRRAADAQRREPDPPLVFTPREAEPVVRSKPAEPRVYWINQPSNDGREHAREIFH